MSYLRFATKAFPEVTVEGGAWSISNTKDNWDGSNDFWSDVNGETADPGFDSQARAQSFTLAQTRDITYCKLRAVDGGGSGDLFCEVRSTLGGAALVTSGSIAISTLPAEPALSDTDPVDPSVALTEFTFASTQLTAGQYFLVVRRSAAFDDVSNAAVRQWRESSQDYAGGEAWVLNDGTWEKDLIAFTDEIEMEFEVGGA